MFFKDIYFQSNGTYKLENNSAVSSEDLLAFYESLLVEFPCIELIADPFADNVRSLLASLTF